MPISLNLQLSFEDVFVLLLQLLAKNHKIS